MRCPTATKHRYATQAAAEREAAQLTVLAGGVRMRAYACPCGWWHLTRRHAVPLPAKSPAPGRSA